MINRFNMLMSLWIVLCCCQASYYFENGEQQGTAAERHSRFVEERGGGPGPRPIFGKRRPFNIRTSDRYTIDGAPRGPVTLDKCKCPSCNKSEEVYKRGHFENVVYNKETTVSSFGGSSFPPCAATNGLIRDETSAPYIGFRSTSEDQMPWIIIDLENAITFDQFILYQWFQDSREQDRFIGLDVLIDGRVIKAFPSYGEESGLSNNHLLDVVINMTEPETGRYLTVQRREGESDAAVAGSNMIRITEVEIWVCKPCTWGNRFTGCQPCPENCSYACDNHYGCQKVLYNVAVRKPTGQNFFSSAEGNHGDRDNIVDGRTAGTQPSNCLVILAPPHLAMGVVWYIQLGAKYKIEYVYITARKDCCGVAYMRDFWVLVLDKWYNVDISQVTNKGENCAYQKDGIPSRTRKKIECVDDRVGTVVALYGNSGELSVCEFEAFGYRIYDLQIERRCYPDSKFAFCRGTAQGLPGFCEDNVCKIGLSGLCFTNEHCAGNAVCHLHKCKLVQDEECDPDNSMCMSTTICDASVRKCKLKLGLSNSCTPGENDPRCPTNSKCDSLGRCALSPNQECEETSQCTAGAQCQNGRCTCTSGSPVNDQCRPQPGQIRSSCGVDDECDTGTCQNGTCTCAHNNAIYFEDYSCRLVAGGECVGNVDCAAGLRCDSTCRIAVGESCIGNEGACEHGTTCVARYCLLVPGSGCTGKGDFCVPWTRCISGKCKIPLGGECRRSPLDCERQFCSDGICSIPRLQSCTRDTGRFCGQDTFCENNELCKINIRQICSSDEECREGTRCVTRAGSQEKKCRKRTGDSGCYQDDDCQSDNACDALKRCSIPKGGSCQQSTDGSLCMAGAKCVDDQCECMHNSTSTTCGLPPGAVGGSCLESGGSSRQCADPWALCQQEDDVCQCGDNFVLGVASLSCRLEPGGRCSVDSNCTNSATCEAGVCSLKVGKSCAGKFRVNCRVDSVCEEKDQVCRLNLHQSCAKETTGCRNTTRCDALHRCKYGAGQSCREDAECMAGSQCSTQTSDRVCECKDDVSTASGDTCVPKEGLVGGACEGGETCKDVNAVCNLTTGLCQCKEGFSGEPAKLTCAKEAGRPCARDYECSVGMVCDSKNGTCRYELGQMCDNEGEDYCASGLLCDLDNLCRLDLKGNCSGNDALCKIGSFCDVLHQCNVAQGDSCKEEEGEEDPCVAGAECVDRVCRCDASLATVYGAVCEPKTGKYGASCQAACTIENSVCEQGQCRCKPNYKPNRHFECEGDEGSNKGKGLLVFGIVTAVVLCIAIPVAVVRHLRQRKAREAVVTTGQEQSKETKTVTEQAPMALWDERQQESSAVSDAASSENPTSTSAFTTSAVSEYSDATDISVSDATDVSKNTLDTWQTSNLIS